jgi:hypothetical protein
MTRSSYYLLAKYLLFTFFTRHVVRRYCNYPCAVCSTDAVLYSVLSVVLYYNMLHTGKVSPRGITVKQRPGRWSVELGGRFARALLCYIICY